MSAHHITTQWKKNMLFESDNPSGKSLVIDDGENGLSPKAMMLSSLAGCSGLDVVSLLNKMRIVIDDFKMEVTGDLTEEHPKYYHTVLLEYHFFGSELNEDKIKKAVNLSIEKYCGVMEMFRKFAKVETKVYFHEQ